VHDFTVLVQPGAYASSVAATLDILHAAAALASACRASPPAWRLVSSDGGLVALSGGLSVATELLTPDAGRDHGTWIIPGLGARNTEELAARLTSAAGRHAIDAIAEHGALGGMVAASCTGVFLLQSAKLLVGRRVTTSWWLAAELRRIEPRCTVDADRMVCADGPVITAGAAFAQADLMLHLLRAKCGAALADAVSRTLLIDGRQAQSPFIVPLMLSGGSDLAAQLTAVIESALPRVPSVAMLAREMAMSERSLARHLRAATGKSALALIQSVRLNRARMLIETSRMSIGAVAEQVGYKDATALRRLMRKATGANPGKFRSSLIGN
jgi:transcriptional regulator GlxA family with amidase domain